MGEPIEIDVDIVGESMVAELELYPGADYEQLSNKPKINDKLLIGNVSLSELGIEALSTQDIDDIMNS